MRKLKIIEHISLDGVIQNSAADGDFPYSDWTARYRTPAGRDAVLAAHGESFDLLLGRRTYDLWSAFSVAPTPSSPTWPLVARSGVRGLCGQPRCWRRRCRLAASRPTLRRWPPGSRAAGGTRSRP